jgi:DNA polymerase
MRLDFDIESCSAIELRDIGSYLYARHPITDVRCASYRLVDDNGKPGPIATWLSGDPVPKLITDIAADPNIPICAFNINFDGQILEQILAPRYAWPAIPRERWRCAQAAALARALPGSLDAVAAALKLTIRKTDKGKAVMRRLAGPKKQTKKEQREGKPLDFSATLEELRILVEHNQIDVAMLTEVVAHVGLLAPAEQANWRLDQVINERGVHIDVPLLDTALTIVHEAEVEVCDQLATLTAGAVTAPKQVQRILKWANEQGYALSNLRKGTVTDVLLEPELLGPVRRLLELRQSGAGAAPSKLPALRRWADEQDHHIRHAYRYHGASSGRFTSLGVQLHNLKRCELTDVAGAIAAVQSGSLHELRRRGFEPPLEVIGQLARAFLTPAPGMRFFCGDLSGIEARSAAYTVGDQRELAQWQAFDRSGRRKDEPYYITGIETFHQPLATARPIGKFGQLAFQYQGGVGAYRRIAHDLTTPDEIIDQRKLAWRAAHPLYTQFWRTSIFQAVQAIRNPGMEFTLKGITFKYDQRTGFLELALPSSRVLSYPQAEIIIDEQYDSTSFTFFDASGGGAGKMYHERKGSGAFGGLMLENITQGICRDIFIEAMLKLEAAGYRVVAHTHDDYVVEVPENFGSLAEFVRIITTPPSWASDLPIAAKARVADRFVEIPEPAQVEIIVTDNALENRLEDLREEADELAQIETTAEIADKMLSEPPPEPPPEAPIPPVLTTLEPEAEPEPELTHVCGQCHLDPPDGGEQLSAYSDVWLHDHCREAFTKARMIEQGVPWIKTKREQAVPDPTKASRPKPPPITGNGGGNVDVSALMALLRPDPAPPPPPRSGNGYHRGEDPRPAAEAEYIYRAADKRMHMRVVRTIAKTFPTYHWSDGAWIVGWPEKVVPYRLPELLTAPADAIVLICEGEKDADTAARYGFIATTNPGGAGKWQPELTGYFKGKQRICLMQDNDEAGAKHTARVLNALRNIVPAIGVVTFPELAAGGDLSDYFAEGGSKQALEVRIERALKTGTARPYIARVAADIEPRALSWLWRGHLAHGALELLTGQVDLGKSQTQMAFIACVTGGRPWPDGTSCLRPQKVILITSEDQADDTIIPRARAAGVDMSKFILLEGIKVGNESEPFTIANGLQQLEQMIRDYDDVGLLGLDPITACMANVGRFDSHRATDVRRILGPLKELTGRLKIAVSAITHPPKGTKATALDSFIGSQAYIAQARIAHMCVPQMLPDDQGIKQQSNRSYFTRVRFALGKRETATFAYHLDSKIVGYDQENNEPIIGSAKG